MQAPRGSKDVQLKSVVMLQRRPPARARRCCGAPLHRVAPRRSMRCGAEARTLWLCLSCTAGSRSLASQLCMDKLETANQLAELYPSGVSTPPKHTLPVPELLAAAEDEEAIDKLFEQLRGYVGVWPLALSIYPARIYLSARSPRRPRASIYLLTHPGARAHLSICSLT
jgi:hypothetical protein